MNSKVDSIFDLEEYKDLHIKDIDRIIELFTTDFFDIFNENNLKDYKILSQNKVKFEKKINQFLKLKGNISSDMSDLLSFYFKVVIFEIYRQKKYFNSTKNIESFFNHLVGLREKNKKLINIELLVNSSKSKIKKEYDYDYKSNIDHFNVLKKVYSSSSYINYYNFNKLSLYK